MSELVHVRMVVLRMQAFTSRVFGRPHREVRTSGDEVVADELRASVLGFLTLWTAGCGLVAFHYLSDYARPATWMPAVCLFAIGYAVFRLRKMNAHWASRLLVGSLWLVLTASLPIFPDVPLPVLYPLIVFTAAFLTGPWITLLVAVVSALTLLGWGSANPGLVAPQVQTTSLFLIFSSLVLSQLMVHTLSTALEWIWAAYAHAEEKTEEARSRQGELASLNKSLNETLSRLEELTRRLAEAREAAEEARREKAEFAAAVSHELRTPLNIIASYAEMLATDQSHASGATRPESCRRRIEAIHRNASHVSTLIDDILELSQIDARRMALHKERILLQDVVAEAVVAVEDLYRDDSLTLTTELPGDLPPVFADRTRLRQVLINLLTNANRFTEEGGVDIRATFDDSDVTIAVSDTGVGISAEDLPLVFEEFRQFMPKGRGTGGLGLSICRRLIELHGGNTWVESVVGLGSTFYFSLPRAEVVVVTPGRSQSLERGVATITGMRKPRSVVVVDSDGVPGRIIGRYLEGYQAERVGSLDDARRLIEESHAAAAIICDPDSAASYRANGTRRAWADGLPHLPVAFCVLRTNQSVADELGASAYLTKPVTPEQLNTTLGRLSSQWRSIGIIEDDPEMAEVLSEMVLRLRPMSRLWRAGDGRSGLELLRTHPPDVLLLDLLTPGVTGYEVLQEMRGDAGLRGIKVLVVTGAEDRDEQVTAEEVTITRCGGLGVGDALGCLKESLDHLLRVKGTADPGVG